MKDVATGRFPVHGLTPMHKWTALTVLSRFIKHKEPKRCSLEANAEGKVGELCGRNEG